MALIADKVTSKKLENRLNEFSKFGMTLYYLFEEGRVNLNDLENLYMILWRVVNNIDSKRDIRILGEIIVIDATDKTADDGYHREWPKETDCDSKTLESLAQKGLLSDFSQESLEEFYRKYHIDKSYSTLLDSNQSS